MNQKRIFIGNIPHEVTKDEMAEFLSDYGTLESLRMRKGEGFALAQMSSWEENQALMTALEGKMFRGRELHTSLEMSKREARKKARHDFAERKESREKKKKGFHDRPLQKKNTKTDKKPKESQKEEESSSYRDKLRKRHGKSDLKSRAKSPYKKKR